jgi:hypothetical protein
MLKVKYRKRAQQKILYPVFAPVACFPLIGQPCRRFLKAV